MIKESIGPFCWLGEGLNTFEIFRIDAGREREKLETLLVGSLIPFFDEISPVTKAVYWLEEPSLGFL